LSVLAKPDEVIFSPNRIGSVADMSRSLRKGEAAQVEADGGSAVIGEPFG
jgi:hypothetical protein